MKPLIKFFVRVSLWVVTIAMTILLLRAFDSLKLSDLKPWHTLVLHNEFQAKDADDGMTFQDYLAREHDVFEELAARVYQRVQPEDQVPYNRYSPKSFSHPENFSRNWNRSFELMPDKMSGGVLMLHGLTDSPYSMRAISQIFHEHGFYVLGLRTPGHGTIPAELTRTSWEDWLAAARIGLTHVRETIGAERPLYICGYSTGGTVALKLALDAIDAPGTERADSLMLFSPAIAVSAAGVLADVHKMLTFLPFFKKFAWTVTNPEYDPFKYNSFAKHGGGQVYQLSKVVRKQVARFEKQGKLKNMPPVLTFQSVVDSTVIHTELVRGLYNKFVPNNSELILFDVNQHVQVKHFLQAHYRTILAQVEQMKSLPYTLTVVTNEHDRSLQVVAKTQAVNAENFHPPVPLNLSWPPDVYSLSHIAVLFPPDDSIYGTIDTRSNPHSFKIGTMAPRGETSVLTVSLDHVMRIRSNPFFPYVEQRIIDTISEEHTTAGDQ